MTTLTLKSEEQEAVDLVVGYEAIYANDLSNISPDNLERLDSLDEDELKTVYSLSSTRSKDLDVTLNSVRLEQQKVYKESDRLAIRIERAREKERLAVEVLEKEAAFREAIALKLPVDTNLTEISYGSYHMNQKDIPQVSKEVDNGAPSGKFITRYGKKDRTFERTDGEFDLYETPRENTLKVIPYLEKLKALLKKNIAYEPCNGHGAISRVLIEYGWEVVISDISTMEVSTNFLTEWCPSKGEGIIVTNTPYSNKAAFLRKLIDTGLPFAAISPVDSVCYSAFGQELKRLDRVRMLLLDRTVPFLNKGKQVQVASCAWFFGNFPEGYFEKDVMFADD